MLSNEIERLENENCLLKHALRELSQKMEQIDGLKPKSCQYCKHYIQHYVKEMDGFREAYRPIYDGHCTKNVPVSKGGKRKAKPDETCPYFEIGTFEMKRF